MTEHTTTANTATDLPPYYADLPHDGPYERAVAATVAAGLLGQVRPFKNGANLFGTNPAGPAIHATDVATAMVDLAEWIITGLHPLTAWADDQDTEDDEDTDEDNQDSEKDSQDTEDTVEDIRDAVDMKDPEWRP